MVISGFIFVLHLHSLLHFQRVLTTEFIDGIKISETEKIIEQNLSLADVDKKLFTAFAEQIFHTGFIHADPHPGNGDFLLIICRISEM